MAYGIDSVLAHTIPTPTIESSNSHLSWIKATDSNPAAPHSRHTEWVVRRPMRAAMAGSHHEKMKHTAEYIAKHKPAHSMPAVYTGEFSSAAPNTFRATAGAK